MHYTYNIYIQIRANFSRGGEGDWYNKALDISFGLSTLKELQGLIDVLFGLELIVIDKLNHTIFVEYICLSSWQCSK